MTTLLLSVSLLFSFRFIDTAYVTHPVSLNATLNSTVHFTCEFEATGMSMSMPTILFYVDRTAALLQAIIDRGFEEFGQISINNITARRTLSAHAQIDNNNSNIYCLVGSDESDTATLRIQGLLDSVGELEWNLINGSSVNLSWTAPYTLDNVPITGYNINNNINTTNTTTSITLSATDPDVCNMTTITVSAINDVGIGQANNVSFYYERVPTHPPDTSVSASLVEAKLSLNTTVNVSGFCIGEYPNNITVIVLDTNNVIHDSFNVSPQVDDQLIMSLVTLSTNLTIFLVNVSMRNNGGEFNDVSSFIFGILGPVTNIKSSINGCSNITVTWDGPDDDRIRPMYYNLTVYDNVTGSLMNTFKANNNSYQFEDEDLFIHRYLYVITGVNELGEGISNSKTFSYQRVPQSVINHGFNIAKYIPHNFSLLFNVPVTVECVREVPVTATITVLCNGNVINRTSYLIEHARNITEAVPVPQNQICSLDIVFSNNNGSSEPYNVSFNTTATTPTSSATPSNPPITTPSTQIVITAVAVAVPVVVAVIVILLVIILSTILIIRLKMKRKRELSISKETEMQENPLNDVDLNNAVTLDTTQNPRANEETNFSSQPNSTGAVTLDATQNPRTNEETNFSSQPNSTDGTGTETELTRRVAHDHSEDAVHINDQARTEEAVADSPMLQQQVFEFPSDFPQCNSWNSPECKTIKQHQFDICSILDNKPDTIAPLADILKAADIITRATSNKVKHAKGMGPYEQASQLLDDAYGTFYHNPKKFYELLEILQKQRFGKLAEDLHQTCKTLREGAQATEVPIIDLTHPALQTEPSLPHLLNLIAAKIPNKWKEVGIQLGHSRNELDAINDQRSGNASHCYTDVFDTWMKKETRTWANLIEVLMSPSVDEISLATTISQGMIKKFKEKNPMQ